MREQLRPGPKTAYTDEQFAQAYRLYFVDQIGRVKAAKEMSLEPSQVVYMAHYQKKRLAAQA